MTDLHVHLLPGIDDGPKNLSEALDLLALEAAQGVTLAAATPHFNPETDNPERFCMARETALSQLRYAHARAGGRVKLTVGAEVRLTPGLARLPGLGALCYDGTRSLLVELPGDFLPPWAEDEIFSLGLAGYSPVLAHVERCPALLHSPDTLAGLLTAGGAAQMSADALLLPKLRRDAFRLLRTGLVTVLASDAHSAGRRPPRLGFALGAAAEEIGPETARRLDRNAQLILSGRTDETGTVL